VGCALVRRRDQVQKIRAGFDIAERLPEIVDQIAKQFLGAENHGRLHILARKIQQV